MRAKTMGGTDVDLDQGVVDGLRQRLKGLLLLPGDAGYESSRTV